MPSLIEFKERVNADYIKNLIINILASEDKVKHVCCNSYLHPLGFYKIVLGRSNTGLIQRIHVWRKEEDSIRIEEAMHTHSFNFNSFIISGAIKNNIYYRKDSGELYNIMGETKQSDPTLQLEYKHCVIGQVHLSLKKSEIYRCGDYYEHHHSYPHILETLEFPSSTYVEIEKVNVASGSIQPAHYTSQESVSYSRKPLDTKTLTSIFEDELNKLNYII